MGDRRDPDRFFRESRRHPRPPFKLAAQEQMPKVKWGMLKFVIESIWERRYFSFYRENAGKYTFPNFFVKEEK